jgi:chemotaxis protein MotB
MFASSQADKGRAQQVSDSVKKALEGPKLSSILSAVLGGSPDDSGKGNAMMRGPGGAHRAPEEKKDAKVAELLPSLHVLSEDLKKEIDAGQIQISMEPRGLVVSFKQAALFPSGEDVISPTAMEAVGKMAAAIAKLPNPVRLEGHTDSIPIKTARFRSNWELSAARSIAMMELLSTRLGVARERMSITGYADVVPLASNETDAGRARNRRVDVVILNEQGLLAEPMKIAGSNQGPSNQDPPNQGPPIKTTAAK